MSSVFSDILILSKLEFGIFCTTIRVASGILPAMFFYAKFSLDNFDFSSDLYAFDFCIWRDLKFPLNHNFKQLNSIGGNLILKVK